MRLPPQPHGARELVSYCVNSDYFFCVHYLPRYLGQALLVISVAMQRHARACCGYSR